MAQGPVRRGPENTSGGWNEYRWRCRHGSCDSNFEAAGGLANAVAGRNRDGEIPRREDPRHQVRGQVDQSPTELVLTWLLQGPRTFVRATQCGTGTISFRKLEN